MANRAAVLALLVLAPALALAYSMDANSKADHPTDEGSVHLKSDGRSLLASGSAVEAKHGNNATKATKPPHADKPPHAAKPPKADKPPASPKPPHGKAVHSKPPHTAKPPHAKTVHSKPPHSKGAKAAAEARVLSSAAEDPNVQVTASTSEPGSKKRDSPNDPRLARPPSDASRPPRSPSQEKPPRIARPPKAEGDASARPPHADRTRPPSATIGKASRPPHEDNTIKPPLSARTARPPHADNASRPPHAKQARHNKPPLASL